MAREDLSNLLHDLRQHLPEHEATDQQKALLDEIEAHIHAPSEPTPTDPTLADAVTLLVETAEQEHPKTAAVARSILETLAGIGI